MPEIVLEKIMCSKGVPKILVVLLKGPNSAPELVYDCRVDTRTIGRGLRELLGMKMIRKVEPPGRATKVKKFYELTPYGRDTAEVVKAMRETMIVELEKVMRKHHHQTHPPEIRS